MKKTDDIKDLLTALSKAQGKFKPVAFDRSNPHYKSKYASLSAIEEMIKAPLESNGLSIIHILNNNDKGDLVLETVLGHVSGQWIASEFRLLLSKQDMQGLGSAVTYAKRYALSALLNVSSDEDDDGNAAVAKPSAKKTSTPPSPFPDEWPDQHAQPTSQSVKQGAKAAAPKKEPPKNLAPGAAQSQPSKPSNPGSDDRSLEAIEEDLVRQLQAWKFPVGQHTGKTLLDLGFENSNKYASWVVDNEAATGKPAADYMKEAVRLFEVYRKLLEVQELLAVEADRRREIGE